MMTDDEFKEFLDALARKHLHYLRLRRHHPMGHDHLGYELETMIKLRQLTGVTEDDLHNEQLVSVLAKKLKETYLSGFIDGMEMSGALRALEEDPETLFGNLRMSAIPNEDIELLQRTGHSDPRAEIILLIHYARNHLANRQRDISLSDAIHEAPELIREAGIRLERPGPAEPSDRYPTEKKKRKIFNGVGKILSGGILGTGNLLLGAGGIVAPNPGVAYGVIGSCAVAVASICQGIGDLRGE